MANGKSIENMRDCAKEALLEGSQRGDEFKKMRHAIILELKRVGFTSSDVKDKLLEWNQRCETVLSPGEQKRQLLKYVDWVDSKECKIGCKGLEDFCLGPKKCSFYKKKTYINKKQIDEVPLDFNEARRYLEQRYSDKGDGRLMSLILQCLRRTQVEKVTGETIFIGYRGIARLLRDHYGHSIDPMTVSRRIQDLISEGMIEIVVRGRRGEFNQPANGYQFLKWKAPE